MRDSGQAWEILFQQSPMAGLVSAPHNGVIIALNDAAARLFDRHVSQIVGLPLDAVIAFEPPASVPALGSIVNPAKVLVDGPAFSRVIEATTVDFESAHGPRQLHWLREFPAGAQAGDLIAKTYARTAEALRVKTDFLATMSHEIRTPLNAILGMSALLAETKLARDQLDFVESIQLSGTTLLAVVNDILDFAKIENGKLVMERVEFDLRAVVEDAIDLMIDRAAEKGIPIRLRVAPGLDGGCVGDPTRIMQVIMNLLSNAVNFIHTGAITVRVEEARDLAPARYIRIYVSDTGPGIPLDAQANLFQRFTQADSSTTRRYGGTGLGLAISRRLVLMMNGEIGLESEVGEGSTFWFTAELPPSARRFPRAPLEQLCGAKALVVDPNEHDRRALAAQLAALGLEVDDASNGLKALAMQAQAAGSGAPYQLLFANREMPVMDGLQLCRLVRSQDSGGSLATFLVASSHAWGPLSGSDSAVVGDRLVKPVRELKLHAALARVLASWPSARAPVPPAGPPVQALPRRTPHILVAEDNPVNQRFVTLMLDKLGCTSEVAHNGADALQAFQSGKCDLIFMDCHMPQMDGFAATRHIRALGGAGATVPIIALTADVMESTRERCHADGMSGFLTKPTGRDAIASVLRQWLSESAQRPA